MAYKRKTRYLHVVQQRGGIGWEDVDASYDRKAMLQSVRSYRENQPEYDVRMVTRRERIAQENRQ